ncbi:MAG: TonB-dependent receptor plug domain-containing protein [Nibricoccus sp.]
MPTPKTFLSSIYLSRAVYCAALVLLTTPVASAQTAPAAEKPDTVTLDRYLVTGSAVAMPPNAVPVTVVTSKMIEEGGVGTNLLEILRKQVPALSGSSNIGLTNASTGVTNTYGGERAAIHNSSTLVLLNGRRVATNGANGRGGASFVDLGQFPVSAIERVEVLTDGASAVYGTDAVGGVVNIILKPAFNGSAIGGRYAFSNADGDYSERSAYFVTGVQSGRLGVIVTGDYSKNTPLFQNERPFSNVATSPTYSGVVSSSNAVVNGTYYLNPAINSPREAVATGPTATAANMAALVTAGVYVKGASEINLAPAVTLNAAHEKTASYVGLNYQLIDKKLQAFSNILFNRANTFTQLGAQAVTVTAPANSPYNPISAAVPGVAVRYLPAPRQYRILSHETNFVAGLKGELSPDWNWEAAYSKGCNRILARVANVLYSSNLQPAVAGGYDVNGNSVPGGRYSRVRANYSDSGAWVIQPAFDPFARSSAVDPASLANVLGTSRADFESGMDSFDLVVRGKFDGLPAGSAELAIGGNYRDEQLSGMPDDNSRYSGLTAQRWSGGTFFDPLVQSRYVRAGFVECNVPVTSARWNVPLVHALDLSMAFRMEDYNEAGVARVPKYGLRWQPFDDQLTFRYTHSKSFTAPTLYQLYGPRIQGSSSSMTAALGYNDTASRQGTQIVISNPNLSAATARSDSVGVVFLPKFIPGLRVSIDYLDLKMNGLIGTIGALAIVQNVNQLGAGSPYANYVTLNGASITTPGQVRAFLDSGGSASQVVITDMRRNYSGAVVQTVDTSIDYVLPAKGLGQFEFGTAGSFFLHDKIQSIPTEPFYEYANLATSAEGTMPAYRFYSHVSWKKAGWNVILGQTYIPSVYDLGSGGSTFANSTTLVRTRVGSFTAWDIGAGYELKLNSSRFYVPQTVALRVGVNNVSDHLAPPASQAFPTTSAGGADVATYGAVGRLYYVSAEIKF